MDEYMLTTSDNPIDPFDDFEAWFKMDLILGHNTCGLLAEYANTSPIFSDEVNEQYTREAANAIVLLDPELYRIIPKPGLKVG